MQPKIFFMHVHVFACVCERERERTSGGFCLPVGFCNDHVVSAHYTFCSLDIFTQTKRNKLKEIMAVFIIAYMTLRLPVTVPFINISSTITIGTAR